MVDATEPSDSGSMPERYVEARNLPNTPPGTFAGEPGTVWTNDTDQIVYQFHCEFKNSCARCIQYAGRIGSWWPVPLHAGCDCKNVPIRPGQMSAPFVDHMVEMRALAPEEQAHAMGKECWQLVDSGTLEWTDVVTRGRIRTLEEVVASKNLTVGRMMAAGIPEQNAQRAYDSVHTPEELAAQEKRRAALAKLEAAGMSREEIKAELRKRLLSRISFGGAPHKDKTD